MTATHATENLTIHLKVKDYATWRTDYDGHEKGRLSAGITNGRVFRNAQDPNDLVILQDVADVAKAALGWAHTIRRRRCSKTAY